MSIWDKMNELTSGKTKQVEPEPLVTDKAKPGDTITGTITNIIASNPAKDKKGGYGFIASPQLPYERIFFHWSGLRQDTLRFPDLKKRMKVEFKLELTSNDGYRAVKILVLNVPEKVNQ